MLMAMERDFVDVVALLKENKQRWRPFHHSIVEDDARGQPTDDVDSDRDDRSEHDDKLGGRFTAMCAPMVRYSRLAFRMVARAHGCDVVYTPMMVASSFNADQRARDADFETIPRPENQTAGLSCPTAKHTFIGKDEADADDASRDRPQHCDWPLIAQFAAKDAGELARAAELIQPYVDGVDLNCGCPQRWAMADGLGASLTNDIDRMADMIQTTRRVFDCRKTVSVKVRLRESIEESVELARRAEKAGASFISVHGRTPSQRHCPVDYDSISTIVSSVDIPVIANGDINTLEQAIDVVARTGVHGVMSARGMLSNPAMFRGYESTPKSVVEEYLETAIRVGTGLPCIHHHLIYMMSDVMSRAEKREFNRLSSVSGIIEYLRDSFGMFSTPTLR